jgi:uncharacterized protein (TIGR03083 family)
MPRPATRADLLAAIDTELARLAAEVSKVPPADRLRPGACGDWSVKDLLSHLDAWHEMFLGWEAVGARGGKPEIPAPGHTWSTTPALNEEIRRRHQDEPWDEVAARLADSASRVRALVERHDDDALFTKRLYAWTGSTSLGSYAVSCTSSHYAWASDLIRRFAKAL